MMRTPFLQAPSYDGRLSLSFGSPRNPILLVSHMAGAGRRQMLTWRAREGLEFLRFLRDRQESVR
jgi:hypothetical protein